MYSIPELKFDAVFHFLLCYFVHCCARDAAGQDVRCHFWIARGEIQFCDMALRPELMWCILRFVFIYFANGFADAAVFQRVHCNFLYGSLSNVFLRDSITSRITLIHLLISLRSICWIVLLTMPPVRLYVVIFGLLVEQCISGRGHYVQN